MSYRELALQTFHIAKKESKIKKDLVSLFSMDTDYNGDNGAGSYEYWEQSDQKWENGDPIPLAIVQGFETEAHRLVDKLFSSKADDRTNIETILNHIDECCHGDYSTQFTHEIQEVKNGYVVAVAFLWGL